MARKTKKQAKKFKINSKLKRVFGGLFVFFALICLGAAFSDGVFRTSVGIDGFDMVYPDVSSRTRKALKSELENFILLNTGDKSSKSPKFVMREGQAYSTHENEDGEKYSAFYIDNDALQISAYVQLNWKNGFADPDRAFIARVDCASGEDNKYADGHCYSRSTGESARALQLENLGLLESYAVPSDAVDEMQGTMLEYLKKVYPELTAALIKKESIRENGSETSAELGLDNGKLFELIVKNDKNWAVELHSGENIIWQSNANHKISAFRNPRVLKKLLPVENTIKSGARYVLKYDSDEHLSISFVGCPENANSAEFELAAKQWLRSNNFDAEAFDIKLKNVCKN